VQASHDVETDDVPTLHAHQGNTDRYTEVTHFIQNIICRLWCDILIFIGGWVCFADEGMFAKPVVIPVPVPLCMPTPMAMYTTPTPYPVPLPIPVPVPCFIPLTKRTAEIILKHIKVC
jgi:hypothetical protein